ncbi:MAG: hypothetical protein WCY27_02380 [archaeon]|jgi:hypothetical protein|nr:hypothetical protein [archaeon]MDD2477424.1 hypothetical protein [Candidatus ainarchaeum sp.]MDD3084719.1 hypothetical protein [Candidatus ainarchaeum sp.]MDD4220955.1 hypothetical protein [Candidatus ainarchaeum sp.]MDD4662475.1 hypothetical protein [Candidatus ainarchaeum sp.]
MKSILGFFAIILGSLILILLGIVYFTLSIWAIKISANWAGYGIVDASTVVLTAGIITAASLIGGAIRRY